jgi:hypothetical protein
VEPLFLPLIVFGLVALLCMLIRLFHRLLQARRAFPPTPSMAQTDARQRALGKLVSLLLWLGLLLLDSVALLYVFVQGDDDRVLSGRVVAVMLLVSSGLMIVALWVRPRLRRRRALGGSATT